MQIQKIILVIFISLNSWGYDLHPHFESPTEKDNLVIEKTVATKESVVEINGSKFREIQYKSEKFYFHFKENEPTLQDDSYCLKQGADSGDMKLEPYRVVGEVEIGKRTEVFIEGIRVKCQKVANLNDVALGISYKNKDGTTTRVEVNPLSQDLGLSEEKEDGTGKKVLINPTGAGAGLNW